MELPVWNKCELLIRLTTPDMYIFNWQLHLYSWNENADSDLMSEDSPVING